MLMNRLRKQMKGVIIVVCIAFAVTLLYVGGTGFLGSPYPSAEAVAHVNGKAIDARELQQAVVAQVNMYRQFGQNISRIQEEDVRYNALRQMIDYEIMLQAAAREKIPVDRRELNDRMNELKEYYGSSFRQILRQEGLTERQVRDILRSELQVEAMRERQSAVEVTDEDVRQAYERSLLELETRHILITPPNEEGELNWDAALELAEDLRAQIQAGADFEQLAMEYSEDFGSAMNGGSIGWIRADDPLVPEFIESAFSLEGEEVSAPVRSVYGYHLIQVTDRRTNEGEPFEEVEAEIRQRLEQERGLAQFEAWLDEERERAEIAIVDPQMRAYQFLQNNQLDQAIAQYREAIVLQPFNPYLHYRLATVLERVNAPDEALAAYKEAASLGGGDAQLWFALGNAYQERGMTEDARDAYLSASESSPLDVFMHQILEQVFLQLGYPELAEAEAEKIAEIEALLEEQDRLMSQFGLDDLIEVDPAEILDEEASEQLVEEDEDTVDVEDGSN